MTGTGHEGKRLGEILLAHGAIDDEALARALAQQAGADLVDPRAVRVDPEVLTLIDKDEALRLEVLPVGREKGRVVAVVADPFRTDRQELEAALGSPVELLVGAAGALRRGIEAAWGRLGARAPAARVEPPAADAEGDGPASDEGSAPAPAPPQERAAAVLALPEGAGTSVAELAAGLRPDAGPDAARPLVVGLVAGALHWGADALRLDRGDGSLAVSYCLDGVWRELVRLPGWAAEAVDACARGLLGVAAGAPLEALDGLRIEGRIGDVRTVAFAASTMRQQGLDRLTLEVRDPARNVRLEQFGLSPDAARRLRQWTSARQGLVLIVGTHSSGRTNLLRGIADQVAAYRSTAQVLRDPVGEPAGTWLQRGASDADGAAAVSAALREDPRVLVVDDCDGPRTAAATFAAALTDRLVVAALRGRDAAEALQRLRDEGMTDLLLGEPLLGVVETRLVRLLCRSCWIRGSLDVGLATRLGLVVDTMPPEVPRTGAGCPACHHTGYSGRRALVSRVELEGGVKDGSSPEELRQAVTMNRPRTPAEVGLGLVVQGLTSVEEIARVMAPRPRTGGAPKPVPRPEPPVAKGAAAAAAPDATAAVAAEAEASPGAAAGPVVTLASPAWSADGPEETVADAAVPRDDGDSGSVDTFDLGELVDFEEGDGDDRHVVLAIDPREELSVELASALPASEFRVVAHRTLQDAVAHVRAELPTAVALTAGWHFDCGGALRALRDDLASAFLPLLVVSEDDESNVELLRAGADEVLASGIPAEELELRLRAVIRRVT